MLTMMRLEFDRNAGNILDVKIPRDADILHFGGLGDKLCLWFMADAEKPETKTIHLFLLLDGMSMPDENCEGSRHLFSAVIAEQAWHLYEMNVRAYARITREQVIVN